VEIEWKENGWVNPSKTINAGSERRKNRADDEHTLKVSPIKELNWWPYNSRGSQTHFIEVER
jgi:hypothetical protein